ncbi:unnamed protein product, partial [Orchesella dallaii]
MVLKAIHPKPESFSTSNSEQPSSPDLFGPTLWKTIKERIELSKEVNAFDKVISDFRS